ncbi:MAG: IS1634 family transposase [Gammaproteobacteria bacterium]|nr:IS1634 family transposase [Gammaproteobacteria bacterium]
MFIRKTTRKYKEKTYTNYLLVESVHTPKGPRQKVICSLGDLSPRPARQWLQLAHKIEDALVGQANLFEAADAEVEQIVRQVRRRPTKKPRKRSSKRRDAAADEDLIAIHADQVRMERPREAGPVHVGYQFWKRLGMEEILRGLDFNSRAIQLTCAMTLNRLIHPSSEHAMPDWIRRTALDDILGVDFNPLVEDPLYRNLDRLHPNRVAVERALVERERNLFNLDQTIFLYDLTSTYFEGKALRNPKAQRGYSRDKRPDCKQVVVGLVINRDGFPIAHEIFAGNVQDRQTLGTMLDLLAQRVGFVEGQTVVVDRGMAYPENLQEIKDRQLHYIVATRQSERDAWLDDFQDQEGFEEIIRVPSPLNPFQKKSKVQVKRKQSNGETFVLCTSSERTEKDRAIREKQEQRFLADLAKLQKRISRGRLVREVAIGEAIGRLKERYPRVARYHTLRFDTENRTLRHEPEEAMKEKAEMLDGAYLLRTDRDDLEAKEAWLLYMTLTRAENAFRAMKSPLAERPIFHHLEHRVETHIFLCVLAYHLLVAIETTLLEQGCHTSWATVRQTLATHQVATIVLPTDGGKILQIRKATAPEPEHVELYRLLEVPTEIMRPQRTWTQPPAVPT